MRYGWQGGFGVRSGLGSVVRNLIIINVAVYVAEYIFRIQWTHLLGLTPYYFWRGFLWQPFTYMFLHGGFMHLLINMFILWMFGSPLESVWGSKRFLTYYLICGVGAGVLNALVMPGSPIPTVGASGAIYGLLLAFGLLFPNQLIFLYFLIPIKAKYFVIIIGVIEFFTAFSQPNSGIAHFAHLGGMVFGLIYLKWGNWLVSLRRWQRGRQKKQKLKVVWDRNKEMERLQKEVDDLLDKINNSGLDSLSRDEISRLKQASKKLKDWEKQG